MGLGYGGSAPVFEDWWPCLKRSQQQQQQQQVHMPARCCVYGAGCGSTAVTVHHYPIYYSVVLCEQPTSPTQDSKPASAACCDCALLATGIGCGALVCGVPVAEGYAASAGIVDTKPVLVLQPHGLQLVSCGTAGAGEAEATHDAAKDGPPVAAAAEAAASPPQIGAPSPAPPSLDVTLCSLQEQSSSSSSSQHSEEPLLHGQER
ncbi:hypothetical protein TSOC_001685 [Tetrabaena socialis]|uniref:Uncharacterized protein n=1 Tax=Tetrabaena socialis TaxID=47790 RepID=A0A2J8AG15_9CHLO|nr:hypothetical protein TSOC_001685 [Tetrabaena socialis]|eukprot:PNH11460.1 hypothetical protein TSOC_001685 [Tetrabaena socialis]